MRNSCHLSIRFIAESAKFWKLKSSQSKGLFKNTVVKDYYGIKEHYTPTSSDHLIIVNIVIIIICA